MEVTDTESPRLPRLGVSADAGMLVALESRAELARLAELCLQLRSESLYAPEADDIGRSANERWAQLADALLTGRLPRRRAPASAVDPKGLALNRYNSFDALVWTLLTVFDEVDRSSDTSFCMVVPRRTHRAAVTSIRFDRTPEVFWVCPGGLVDTRSGRLTVKTPFWCVAGVPPGA